MRVQSSTLTLQAGSGLVLMKAVKVMLLLRGVHARAQKQRSEEHRRAAVPSQVETPENRRIDT